MCTLTYIMILLSFIVLYDYFLRVNMCACHVYSLISLLIYFTRRSSVDRADLGDGVWIVLVLQQQRQRLDVVLLGGDVQRRKLEPGTSVGLEQQCRHLVVVLLNGDRQRRETALHTM